MRCEECLYESVSSDTFLDLSLPIRNNPTSTDPSLATINSSLEMALENFMRPEKLESDNKYMCGNCKKMVDAQKGLKIKTLPKVLTVQLSRFTLDWSTFQMVKVYDRVSFPFILNGNNYLQGYDGIKNKHSDKVPIKKQ